MARPRGDLINVVLQLMTELRRSTWRQVHALLVERGVQASAHIVRKAMDNLACRGWLRRDGVHREPGVYRPLRVFTLPDPAAPEAVIPLAQVMGQWGAPAGQA